MFVFRIPTHGNSPHVIARRALALSDEAIASNLRVASAKKDALPGHSSY
jgi:hypothetical protein